jgi:N6-L-threonylcarbamoyladenine synthase
VAANRELRVRFTAEAAERALPVAFPSVALATDNAAMIAAAAWPKFIAGKVADEGLTAEPGLALGRQRPAARIEPEESDGITGNQSRNR